ncbi:MAG: hypothetical protein AAGK05_03655, partial [Pseudomonadota bacterium]
QLYHKLEILSDCPSHEREACCTSELTEDEVDAMDHVLEIEGISAEEKSVLYYISGYIAFKESFSQNDENIGLFELEQSNESEFTQLVSRGKLSIPPDSLYYFSLHSYVFFLSKQIHCASRLIKAFAYLYDSLGFDFPNHFSICRRFANCFLKGMVTRQSDLLLSQSRQIRTERRKRKLSSE